jgi:predicted metal-binding membrane protein
MMSLATFKPFALPGQLRQFFWRWPEWWIFVLCGLGWRAMLLHSWRYAAHGIHHRMSFADELLNWMLMVFAMMFPLIRDAVRFTAFSSLWTRRHQAMAAFIVAYCTPWLAMGLAVAWARQVAWTHNYAVPAVMFLLAGLWQITPMHGVALVSCHRTMALAPSGWRADRDCLRFGGTIGFACLSSCWPLMLACAATGHSLAAMVGGMALGLAEQWSFRPRTGVVLAGTLLLATYYAALAFAN